jgi:hypothetical protein
VISVNAVTVYLLIVSSPTGLLIAILVSQSQTTGVRIDRISKVDLEGNVVGVEGKPPDLIGSESFVISMKLLKFGFKVENWPFCVANGQEMIHCAWALIVRKLDRVLVLR